jgi:hypothetical protein
MFEKKPLVASQKGEKKRYLLGPMSKSKEWSEGKIEINNK